MAFDRKKMREAAERQRQKSRESGEGAEPAGLDPELARFASDSQAGDEVECPACAELIKAKAKVCKHCGHDVGRPVKGGRGRDRSQGSRRLGRAGPVQTKSPGTAAVLAFFMIGLGHIYGGRIGMGLLLMFGWPTVSGVTFSLLTAGAMRRGDVNTLGGALLVFLLVAVCVWLWQIYDAYSALARPAAARSPARRRRRAP